MLGGAYLVSSAANAAEVPTKYECDNGGGVTVYGSGTRKVKITKDGDKFKSEPPNTNSDGRAFSAAVATLRAACAVAPDGISRLNTTIQGNGQTVKEGFVPQRATQ